MLVTKETTIDALTAYLNNCGVYDGLCNDMVRTIADSLKLRDYVWVAL